MQSEQDARQNQFAHEEQSRGHADVEHGEWQQQIVGILKITKADLRSCLK
jgi:hypothetical protein